MVHDRPRLREARQAAGLTQRQLADKLGVPQPVIARYETGAREPMVRAAVRIAQVLGTTAHAIWAADETSPGAAATARGATAQEDTHEQQVHRTA